MTEIPSMENSILHYMNTEIVPHYHIDEELLDQLSAIDREMDENREERALLFTEVDSMWDDLWSQAEQPILLPSNPQEIRKGAYTGHRHVTFEGRMGRSALGFQLIQNGDQDERIISAFRRKVYAQSRRRANYTADEFHLYKKNLFDSPMNKSLVYDISVMRIWVDKFLQAEKYK